MSGPNTPNSSFTTAPPNSPASGNPLAIPELLRAAIKAKNARLAANQLEIETEQTARDLRRLMSRESLESLVPISAKDAALLQRSAFPRPRGRDPEATDIPARLARAIQLQDMKADLRRGAEELEEQQRLKAAAGPVVSDTDEYEASDAELTDSGTIDDDTLVSSTSLKEALAYKTSTLETTASGSEIPERKRDRARRLGKRLLRRMSTLKPGSGAARDTK